MFIPLAFGLVVHWSIAPVAGSGLVLFPFWQVLVAEREFYEVTVSYLTAMAAQNVSHAEIFFDPQVRIP